MIEANGLTKRYGKKVAVDDVTFTGRSGRVTGFLGPNGGGKCTTMRMIVGLDRPTSGQVMVNGKTYARHAPPLGEVGALLEARAVHTSRTGYHHLRAIAATHGIPRSRVTDVIEMTGLRAVAHKRVGGFSLGMGQRLGIAAALLGDPRTLILDEPVNGLDPEGVKWVRNIVRYLASEGRTVFLSSHLMSEMSLTADHLLVIGRGKTIAGGPVQEIIDAVQGTSATVRTPRPAELAAALEAQGASVRPGDAAEVLEVRGASAADVGEAALAAGIVLHELTPVRASLEDAYMSLTQEAVEFHSAPTGPEHRDGAHQTATHEGIQQ